MNGFQIIKEIAVWKAPETILLVQMAPGLSFMINHFIIC